MKKLFAALLLTLALALPTASQATFGADIGCPRYHPFVSLVDNANNTKSPFTKAQVEAMVESALVARGINGGTPGCNVLVQVTTRQVYGVPVNGKATDDWYAVGVTLIAFHGWDDAPNTIRTGTSWLLTGSLEGITAYLKKDIADFVSEL